MLELMYAKQDRDHKITFKIVKINTKPSGGPHIVSVESSPFFVMLFFVIFMLTLTINLLVIRASSGQNT